MVRLSNEMLGIVSGTDNHKKIVAHPVESRA
jgi:hypothetical protein